MSCEALSSWSVHLHPSAQRMWTNPSFHSESPWDPQFTLVGSLLEDLWYTMQHFTYIAMNTCQARWGIQYVPLLSWLIKQQILLMSPEVSRARGNPPVSVNNCKYQPRHSFLSNAEMKRCVTGKRAFVNNSILVLVSKYLSITGRHPPLNVFIWFDLT